MTQTEYEQKKRECWEQFCNDNGIDQEVNISIFDAFDQIFDRAYALGKQTETVTQEEIEKASVEYADKTAKQYEVCNSEFVQEIMVAFEQGANYALGKQEEDAEGEEMLTCDRDVVRMLYDRADSVKVRQTLESLFGSKCLPDEVAHEDNFASKEPQPAEPKFKEGDRAIYCIPEKQRIKARVVNVRQRSGSTLFNTLFNYDIRLDDGRTANWVDEQWLLPDNDDQVRAVTEKASERFDKILAKDLRKEKRLRIATQLMAAMMSNPVMFNKSIEYEDIVHGSLEYADAIIEAVEKGDSK